MRTVSPKAFKATAAETQRRLEAQHLQIIEGNPLTEAEIDMFEMFERQGWNHERRGAHIRAQFKRPVSPEAVERRRSITNHRRLGLDKGAQSEK